MVNVHMTCRQLCGRCPHESTLSLTYLTIARRQHCMGGARILQDFALLSSLCPPWGRSFGGPPRLPSLLSSLSPLFPPLSLLLTSQIAHRTCHCDLCIRPSTSPQTASTLCGPIPGPSAVPRHNPGPSPSIASEAGRRHARTGCPSTPRDVLLPSGTADSPGRSTKDFSILTPCDSGRCARGTIHRGR